MGLFSGISKVAESVRGILDDTITTKEEKAEAILAQFESEVRDRESARDMYKDDSWLQKVYAITFLIIYGLLLAALFVFIYTISRGGDTAVVYNVPEWAQALLVSLFTQMTAKIQTVCDFLFGGSKSMGNVVDKKRK